MKNNSTEELIKSFPSDQYNLVEPFVEVLKKKEKAYARAANRILQALKELERQTKVANNLLSGKLKGETWMGIFVGFDWFTAQSEIERFFIEKRGEVVNKSSADYYLSKCLNNFKKIKEVEKKLSRERKTKVIEIDIFQKLLRKNHIKSDNELVKPEINQEILDDKMFRKIQSDYFEWKFDRLYNYTIPKLIDAGLDRIFKNDRLVYTIFGTFNGEENQHARNELFKKIGREILNYILEDSGQINIDKISEVINIALESFLAKLGVKEELRPFNGDSKKKLEEVLKDIPGQILSDEHEKMLENVAGGIQEISAEEVIQRFEWMLDECEQELESDRQRVFFYAQIKIILSEYLLKSCVYIEYWKGEKGRPNFFLTDLELNVALLDLPLTKFTEKYENKRKEGHLVNRIGSDDSELLRRIKLLLQLIDAKVLIFSNQSSNAKFIPLPKAKAGDKSLSQKADEFLKKHAAELGLKKGVTLSRKQRVSIAAIIEKEYPDTKVTSFLATLRKKDFSKPQMGKY